MAIKQYSSTLYVIFWMDWHEPILKILIISGWTLKIQSLMDPDPGWPHAANLRVRLKHHILPQLHCSNAHLCASLNIPQPICITQNRKHFSSSRYFLFASS